MIVCIRLPHFKAEAARQAAHLAQAVPLVLSHPQGRKVIASCAAATRHGIFPGTPLRQVQTLCSEARVLSMAAVVQEQALEQHLTILAEFTPLIEPPSTPPTRQCNAQLQVLDTQQAAVFYVDLEILNFVESIPLARQIGSAIRENTGQIAHIGLAANKFTAYAAAVCSQAGRVLPVAPGEEATFLGALPVTLLPMTEDIRWRLHLLGLDILGKFAALPASAVLTQFGRDGLFIHQLTQGTDYRSVIPFKPRLVEQVKRIFDERITNNTVLEAIARSAAVELAARLQAKGCMGRTLTLRLQLDNGTLRESRITLRQSVSGTASLISAISQRLTQIRTGRHAVLSMEVLLTDLIPFAGQQLDLFNYRIGQRERLQKSLDTLTSRYGAQRFYWIESAERHSPLIERRFRLQGVDSA